MTHYLSRSSTESLITRQGKRMPDSTQMNQKAGNLSAAGGSGEDAGDGRAAAAITRLLNEAGAGDVASPTALLPLVYEQLRALAARRLRQERPDQTLTATALVHEAYLRIVDDSDEAGTGSGAK